MEIVCLDRFRLLRGEVEEVASLGFEEDPVPVDGFDDVVVDPCAEKISCVS
jgi:hypothetical protein